MSETGVAVATTASDTSDVARPADLDVLVVGGGVVGAGVALDAVTRGLRVGLVEAGDWGSGRSGNTGTLVHGGLVDLPRIGVGAVAALRRERDLLLDRTAPHLVRRVPLLVPLTRGLPERLSVGAALGVYEAAAFSIRQPAVLPGHRQLPRRAVQRLAPSLDLTDISGAIQLYEAQVDDARLTITVVRTAIAYGAVARSRTRVERLLVEHGRVLGALLAGDGGAPQTVRARCVVLAGGAELDDLVPPQGSRPESAGGSVPAGEQVPAGESVHLVLPRGRLHSSTGLVLRSSDAVVYVVPWGRHWIVGSTASWSDPDLLLAELNRHLGSPIGAHEVESVVTGPAGFDTGAEAGVELPLPGLVTVRGSGLAGYRADAESAVDAAVTQIGGLHPSSTTRRVPLSGADGFDARWNQRHLLAQRAGVPVLAVEHLLHRYGSTVDVLVDEMARRPELARPLPGAEDYLGVEVWFAVAHEDAAELTDVLARRTRIALETPDGGAAAARSVATLMAAELGWDAAEVARQLDDHRGVRS